MLTAWPTAGLCLLIPKRRPRPDRRGRCCLEGLTRAKAAARPRVRAAARVIPSAVGRLLRAAALAAVRPRSRDLGRSARSAALRASLLRHPLLRAENALKQCGYVALGVELGPMQADRKRVVWGNGVPLRVVRVVRRLIKKKK